MRGHQRKVVAAAARPRRAAHGSDGIPVRGGRSLPFSVTRRWVAPAGRYPEQWYLVDASTREVLYESEVREASIWGLQSATELRDAVTEPLALQPGTYAIVFALGGLKGGEISVRAEEVPSEAAA